MFPVGGVGCFPSEAHDGHREWLWLAAVRRCVMLDGMAGVARCGGVDAVWKDNGRPRQASKRQTGRSDPCALPGRTTRTAGTGMSSIDESLRFGEGSKNRWQGTRGSRTSANG
jgi:hypothetical protein